jgi:phosphoribosylamine--glycine ligase
MKVLIIGSGGREHALAWKVSQSPKVDRLFCAPGNAGMAELGECVNIKATDIPALLDFAKMNRVHLAIVGPESPLITGLSDELRSAGIPTFGPSKAAAAIEGSKVFSKELMRKYGIPTAGFEVFDTPEPAKAYIERISDSSGACPIVVKADGEAAGKGVFVCDTRDEALSAIETIMVERAFGESGDRIVIEERMEGQEASLMAITDGVTVVPISPVQDYKRAYDDDKGPNTGGMGCYTPVPIVTDEIFRYSLEALIKPTIDAMRAEGRPYTGVLYTGIMLTKDGPKVLEYNCRFGDPETQVALPMLQNDLVEVIEASIEGRLDALNIRCYNGCAVCVVLASGGYPGKYETGKPITGVEDAASIEGVTVFHAGTKLDGGQVVTAGGRVLGVTGVGESFREARDRAYAGVGRIKFENMHYRKDIGARVIKQN